MQSTKKSHLEQKNMATIKFKRIDLANSGQAVKFGFLQSEATREGEVVEKNYKMVTVDKGPHDDFANTFIKMVPHLLYSMQLAKAKILRPEWFDEYKFLDDERFENVTVTGIDIIDKEDVLKIRLYGRKTTDNGDVCALNSPWIDLYDGGPERYILQAVLADNYRVLIQEADQYWNKQKYAPNPQQVLELI